MSRRAAAAVVLTACVGASTTLQAAPPTWDHIVVVIEENHSQAQIIGNTGGGGSTDGAPYINELAVGGVRFNNFYAIMHPSQPNYLELYAGSNQGVTDDSLPAGLPFTTPNLGAELLAAGRTFAGYSESLPSTALTADSTTAGGYRRKHNPWVNWQGSGSNQYASSLNRDFGAFPTAVNGNFAALPNVSFVVPTQYNDMHDDNPSDGLSAVRAADNWIKGNLKSYADWAVTHNSLLVVTFDEDNGGEGNRIPTVMYGANLMNGTQVNSTWTLHNLLRTMEDSNGIASHAGQAAKTRSIVGAFTTDPAVVTTRFQEGVNGYASQHDTTIRADSTTPLNGNATNTVDPDTDNTSSNGKQITEALVRFDGVFGNGAGQVPANAIIHSAKLVLRTSSGASDVSEDAMEMHRMLVSWESGNAVWTSFGGDGVQANDVEAASAETFHITPDASQGFAVFDITSDVLGWQAGTMNNFGWMINGVATGQDGWLFNSDNAAVASDRPMLEITYSVPEPTLVGAIGVLALGRRRARTRERACASR